MENLWIMKHSSMNLTRLLTFSQIIYCVIKKQLRRKLDFVKLSKKLSSKIEFNLINFTTKSTNDSSEKYSQATSSCNKSLLRRLQRRGDVA